VALRRQVIQLVRLHLLQHADQARGIRQVAIMQHQILMLDVRILIEVVDACRIEERRPPIDPVDLIALVQQKFRQVGAVLPGDASNECLLHTTA
jgi:hypothetical protein